MRWSYTCIPDGISKPKWLGKNGTRISSWPNTIARSIRMEAKVVACLKRAISAHESDYKHRNGTQEPQATASTTRPDQGTPSHFWDRTTMHRAAPDTRSDPANPSPSRSGTSGGGQAAQVIRQEKKNKTRRPGKRSEPRKKPLAGEGSEC